MAKQIRPVISHTNALRDFNIVLTMQKMIQRHQYTFLVFSKVIWRLTPDNHFITRYIMHIDFIIIIDNFIKDLNDIDIEPSKSILVVITYNFGGFI